MTGQAAARRETGHSARDRQRGARLRSARSEANGVAELAVAHDLGGQRCGTAHLAAELADDAGGTLVDVDALAHQWGA